MWLIFLDNIKGKYPEGFFLTTLYNFLNFIKEFSDVNTFILSEKKIRTIEIEKEKSLKVIEKKVVISNVEGIVVSLTLTATNMLIKNESLMKEFLNIIKKLEKDGPLIIFAGNPSFNQLNKYLEEYNVVFEPRIGLNWFNLNLRNRVSQYIKK